MDGQDGVAVDGRPGFGEGLLVFGTANGDLVALAADTGQERRQPIGSEILAPPAIGSGVIAVRTVDGRLRGFSALNGSMAWAAEQNLPSLTLRGNTAPRVAGTRRQRLQQRPRRRLRAGRRRRVGSRDREPDGPQRARALGRRQRRPLDRRQRRLRRRLPRPRRRHRPRDRRRFGSKNVSYSAWAPTSTTST